MPLFLLRFYFLLADIQSNHSLQIKDSATFIYGGGSRRHDREVLKRDVQTDNFISFIGTGIASFFLWFSFLNTVTTCMYYMLRYLRSYTKIDSFVPV